MQLSFEKKGIEKMTKAWIHIQTVVLIVLSSALVLVLRVKV